jgi:hypothetical protein
MPDMSRDEALQVLADSLRPGLEPQALGAAFRDLAEECEKVRCSTEYMNRAGELLDHVGFIARELAGLTSGVFWLQRATRDHPVVFEPNRTWIICELAYLTRLAGQVRKHCEFQHGHTTALCEPLLPPRGRDRCLG